MVYQKFSQGVTMLFSGFALALAVFIVVRSLAPVEAVPSIAHADKWIHAAAYLTLGVFCLPALPRLKPIFGWLVLCMFGISIEIMQGLMSTGRSADVLDALANSVGAFLAVLAWFVFSIFWRRVSPNNILSGESNT